MSGTRRLTQEEIIAGQRELYQRSFKAFVAAAWEVVDTAKFVPNWHIGVLCDHLEAVANGRITRLLINIPPGTAKSIIVGVMFPAWLWTRDPSKRIISASNNLKLATRDSRRTRNLVTSPWYQRYWKVELLSDQNQKTQFENSARGSREAMPFTSMTGSRGNIVIVDDPHSVDGAKSAAERKATVETFLEAVPSRLNDPDKDAIIVVMQRLHEEDVAGAILERPDLGYDHLCIPMEAEEPGEPTSIGWVDHRALGELLFPARWSVQRLKQIQASLGPFTYAGQYQQRPAPATDGYFNREWFPRYKVAKPGQPGELPATLNYYMTSDHAPGGKGDYNVFRVWGVDHQRHVWLVDSFRKRCLMDEALGIVRGDDGRVALAAEGALPLIAKYKPFGWYPEGDGTWAAIKAFVLTAMRDLQIICRIEPMTLKGAGDKEGKAQAYRAMASMGMVHLPEGSVGDEALAEYVQFPVGKHDDQVDADGAIARVLAETMPAYIAPPASTIDPRRAREYRSRFRSESVSDSCW